jgi:hypothetical protein
MKKLLSIMILLAGVISFTSCSNDDITYTAPAQLSLKSADAFYEAAGGTGSIVVNSNESITATSNADWLTVSVSGNTVNLTVAANVRLEGRSTNVVLKSPTASKEVNISQRGIIYGVETSVLEMADTEGATLIIPVAQTAGVSVVSLTEWLTASFNSATSTIELVATSNDEEEAREGQIAIQTGTIKDTLEITQKGMTFILEKTSVQVTEEGGIEAVAIMHSKPVKVESAPEWIECVFNDETSTLTMSIAESTVPTREGIISLTSGKSTKTITVVQEKNDSTATEEPEETLFGTYTFVLVVEGQGYNLGEFTIEEYTGENAQEGDVVIKDFYVPGSEISGYIEGDKLYVFAYQVLGTLIDDEYGEYGNLIVSASNQEVIEFDITEQGIVTTDLCIMATDPGYTQGWWWEIGAGNTTILVQATANAPLRAAAWGNKANKNRNNLPASFKIYKK